MIDNDLKELLASLIKEQKETSEQQKETGKQIKETSEQMKKTDEEMKKTDKRLKKLGKLVGGMSNSQGDVAEEFFINSIGSHQNIGGIQYDFMDKNASRKKDGIEDEFDIVLVNGKDVAIIEVKYKLHQKDIDTLLSRKITNFKKLYPEYKNYTHHLGLASFKIHNDLKQIALDNNIMVLQRKGDIVESFLPKAS